MKTTSSNIQIRFNDLDIAGHVNNAIYLSYFEQGRIDFFNSFLGPDHDWKKEGLILGRAELDYIKPITWGIPVEIEVSCHAIGNKSFTLEYLIFNQEDKSMVFCKGKTVMVCFDYTINSSVNVPEHWRTSMSGQ